MNMTFDGKPAREDVGHTRLRLTDGTLIEFQKSLNNEVVDTLRGLSVAASTLVGYVDVITTEMEKHKLIISTPKYVPNMTNDLYEILPIPVLKKRESQQKYRQKKWKKGEFIQFWQAYKLPKTATNISLIGKAISPKWDHTVRYMELIKTSNNKCEKCGGKAKYRFNMNTRSSGTYSKIICDNCVAGGIAKVAVKMAMNISGSSRVKAMVNREIDEIVADKIVKKLTDEDTASRGSNLF